jgi:thiol-disulfide isomerase/thioredoxin
VIDLDESTSRSGRTASAIVLKANSTFWWSAGDGVAGYCRKIMPRIASHFPVTLLVYLIFVNTPLLAKRAPDPTFKTLDGQSHKLSALHGQIVVVNFWATWCGPCQEELPRLSQIAASYSGKPVSFVFISIDDPKDRGKIPGTLARLHVDFTSWMGADTDTLGSFGLGDIVPGTIILDEMGQPVARVMGEAKESDIRAAVDWLLNGRKGDAPTALTKRY